MSVPSVSFGSLSNVNKPKCVLFDIDDTLGYSDFAVTNPHVKRNAPLITSKSGVSFYWFSRPGLRDLLQVLDYYKIPFGIWTAATKEYAETIVQNIVEPLKYSPHWLLHNHHCSWVPESNIIKKDVSDFVSGIKVEHPFWLDAKYSKNCDVEFWKKTEPHEIWLLDDFEPHFETKTFGLKLPPFKHPNDKTFIDVINIIHSCK